MIGGCPLSEDVLTAWWAGDLDTAESEGVEAHLFECASCAAACERIGAVTEAIRGLIPPVLTRAGADALRARGLAVLENPIGKGERKVSVFPRGTDILLHVLGGLDLSRTENVKVVISDEDSGTTMVEESDAPFDRDAGAIYIACQRHFAVFPPNVVFEVHMRETSGAELTARYVAPHVYEV